MIPQRYHWTPVVEFHTTFGHPIFWTPTVPEVDRRKLRIKLILEELLEFCQASNLGIIVKAYGATVWLTDMDSVEIKECVEQCDEAPNITAAADALADLKYVVEGAALEWGIPLHACFLEVHDSNMSKLGADGKPIVREDGKTLKGPNFRLPDLAAVIKRMEEEVAEPPEYFPEGDQA